MLFEKIDSIYKEILKNIYNLDSATLTSASGFIKTIADELQNYYLLLTKLSTVNENLLNNPATEETWLSAAEKIGMKLMRK
ncbi:MAG: hypothetical protein HWD59_14455 [Coxiellaceae bacterium]|nr:MAG: hypothetical protein HWD59_14455 [Coxiellaceae bacterium]